MLLFTSVTYVAVAVAVVTIATVVATEITAL